MLHAVAETMITRIWQLKQAHIDHLLVLADKAQDVQLNTHASYNRYVYLANLICDKLRELHNLKGEPTHITSIQDLKQFEEKLKNENPTLVDHVCDLPANLLKMNSDVITDACHFLYNGDNNTYTDNCIDLLEQLVDVK